MHLSDREEINARREIGFCRKNTNYHVSIASAYRLQAESNFLSDNGLVTADLPEP